MPNPGSGIARFESRIDKSGDCWLWTGSRCTNGYGQLSVFGKTRMAHRVAWERAFGPIPKGLCVLHRCDVRNCVNPDHLFLGTYADNNRDKAAKGRTNPLRGERNPHARLTEEDVRAIRAAWVPGVTTYRMMADRYGVTISCINHIVWNRSWRQY